MSTIHIITLPPSDWKKYKAIRLSALQSDPPAFAESFEEASVFPDSLWQSRLSDPDWLTLFAQDGEKIIGMIVLHKSTAMIHGVYVSSGHRGKGIGKLLMRAIIERAKEIPGVITVKLEVTETQQTAQALYKSVGFEVIGMTKKKTTFLDREYDEFIMEKTL